MTEYISNFEHEYKYRKYSKLIPNLKIEYKQLKSRKTKIILVILFI